MDNQPKFHAVGGLLHRVIYEPVDQNSVEAEIAAQLDASQNTLNAATQARTEAESAYTITEAAAEQASTVLDAAKIAEEEAESAFQKSSAISYSLTTAKQLAAEQLEQADGEEVDTGDDESQPEQSEAVAVTVSVAA